MSSLQVFDGSILTWCLASGTHVSLQVYGDQATESVLVFLPESCHRVPRVDFFNQDQMGIIRRGHGISLHPAEEIQVQEHGIMYLLFTVLRVESHSVEIELLLSLASND